MHKIILLTFLLISTFSLAQPANDECDFAEELTPSLDLACVQSLHGTVLGATASAQSNTCTYSTDDDDVWYKFTATSITHKIIISNVTGSTTDMYFAVYTNTCSTLGTQILCSDNNSNHVVSLTTGNVYYIRVYTKTSVGGQNTEFDICVSTPPSVPSNNECINAISLDVNPINTCDSISEGTLNGATTSTTGGTCSSTINQDVWYSFVATMSAQRISITPLNESPITYYHAFYTGNCGSLGSAIKCSYTNQSTVTGLTPGQTYFIRVFSSNIVPEGMVSYFSICVSEPPPTPSNDECMNAIQVPVNDDFNYALMTSGTVENATQSNQQNACYSTNYDLADDDVWYVFTAARTTHSIYIASIGGDSPSITYAVIPGTCSNLNTPELCEYTSSPETKMMYNLTVGQTYLVRIYSSDSNSPHNTSFTFGIGSEPRPIHDDCSGAITLNVNLSNVQGGISTSVLYATQSQDLTDCSTTDLADVWYKFTALDTNHIVNITGQYLNSADHMKYDLYSGTCNNLTPIFCDRRYANQMQGLQIDQTYYLKLHAALPNAYYSTSIGIKTVVPRVSCDICENAATVLVNMDNTCDSIFVGSTQNASPSMFPSNNAGQDDDVWVKFVARGQAHSITINYTTNSNLTYDLFFYENCNSSSHFAMANYTNSYILSGLTEGSTYLIRINNSSSSNILVDSFNLCIKNSAVPINDNVEGAISLTVNDTTACIVSSFGTFTNATASPQANTCGITEASSDDDDIWYSFVPLYTGQYIYINRPGSATSFIRFSLYSGSPSSLTQISCYANASMLSNLNVGQTYYLRVYSTGTTALSGNLEVCVSSPVHNDECVRSIEIPVNEGFTCEQDTSGFLDFSTASSPPTTCLGASANDVWFHFVATQTNHWISMPYAYNMRYSVYAGSCGALGTPIACFEGQTPYFSTDLQNLTVGQSYYIRVSKQSPYSSLGYFKICVSTLGGAIPENDECIGAIDLPVNDGFECDTMLSCSITAGVSASYPSTSQCNASLKDVWYKFVASSPKMELSFHYIDGNPTSKTSNIYSGNCGSLTQIYSCGANTLLNNLTVGQTYYLRVITYVFPERPVDDFKICIKNYFVPPNDDCVNAINLPVNHNNLCDSVMQGTNFHATNSTPGTYCGSNVPINDVWYKFTATTLLHTVSLRNLSNQGNSYSPSDVRFNIYNGACTNMGSPVNCTTNGTSTFFNTVIGTTYYVRVFNANVTTNLGLTYDICIGIPPPPPNDECENAILLVNDVDNSCTSSTSGTLQYATPSSQINTCANTSDDDDVWYKFTAGSAAHGLNLIDGLSNSQLYHTVYSGNCQNLTTINCSDPNTNFVPNLSVDSVYYVRVYSVHVFASSQTFKICTGPYLPVPSCSNNTPAGNDCENALAMCDFNGYCGRTSGTYTTESWLEMDTTFCGTIENNSFLSFVPDSSAIDLNVWVTSSVIGLGIQILIFQADNCLGPVQNFACWDPHYVPPGHKLLTANGLIPGNKYYMMIDGQSGDICDYVFGSTSSISNPIAIVSSEPEVCLGDSVILTAGGGDGTFSWPVSSEITLLSENSVYFKPTSLGMNSVTVTSFENSASCTFSSQIQYQINVRECICPIFASNNSDSCVSNSFDLDVSDVFGASFEWTGPSGFSSNLQNPSQVVTPQTAGNYVYTVTATSLNESCSAQTTVVINAIPDASFAYSDTAFCQFGANAIPIITGQTGGIFSSTTFDIDVDAQSGEINLSNILLGEYVISYSTAGFCPQTSTQTIDILDVPSIQSVLDQSICLGESFNTLAFTGSNSVSYSWTNSNSAIGLSVSGIGNINAFEPTQGGEIANIEVTPNGLACNGNPITFNLEVKDNPTVTLAEMDTICSSASDFQFSNGSPAGGTYSGTFVLGNLFQVTQAGVGTHEIVYTFVDGLSNCSSSDTIQVVVANCLSVDEVSLSNKMELFPNPSNGKFTLKLKGSFEYEITDVKGKVVLQSKGENMANIDLTEIAEGLYYVKIKTGSSVFYKEISIVK